MFLRPGGDVAIVISDIIGIFDIDSNVTPEITKEFLRTAEKRGETVTAGNELPKSFILTADACKNSRTVFSGVSSRRLSERGEEAGRIMKYSGKTKG